MALSIGIIFGLIAMLGYGLANALSRIVARNIGSSKSIFFREILVNIILFGVLLFYMDGAAFSAKYIVIAAGIAVLGYLPVFFFYKAMETGEVGIITPIANSSIIYSVALSLIFFHESLEPVQLISIALIILGVIIISIDFAQFSKSQLFSISSGIPFALISSALWGVVYFLLKIPVLILGPFLTSLILELGVMVSSACHMKISKESFSFPDKKMIFYLVLSGAAVATGTLFYNLGILVSDVSIVVALTFANPFIAVICGKIFYGEKLKLMQYAASVMIVVGIILTALH